MQSTAIPYKFTQVFANAATAGFVTSPIPATTASPAISQNVGFPPATAAPIGSGGTPPSIEDFNGMYQYLANWVNWAQAGGAVPWDSTFSSNFGGYPKGCVVASATIIGRQWFSTAENNTTNPDTGGAGWIEWPIHGQQLFTTSGTFTVPDFVTRIRLRCWGAGGGSGGAYNGGNSGGGGGGGYGEGLYTVTPGATYAVTVSNTGGTAGAAGTSPTNGGTGATTIVASLITATGGGGGHASNGAGVVAAGGGGGGSSGGTLLNVSGGSSSGGLFGVGAGGGDGGASFGTPGIPIGGFGSQGVAGNFPGGGAGGTGVPATGANQPGNFGAGGLVIFEW